MERPGVIFVLHGGNKETVDGQVKPVTSFTPMSMDCKDFFLETLRSRCTDPVECVLEYDKEGAVCITVFTLSENRERVYNEVVKLTDMIRQLQRHQQSSWIFSGEVDPEITIH